jgi:hypothetical protein
VEDFYYLGSMITNDIICKLEIKTTIPHNNSSIQQEEGYFPYILDLDLRNKLVKCCIRSAAFYGAGTGTLRPVDQKNLKSSEMWCWRKIKHISWTDRVNNEDVLNRVKEKRSILYRKKECQLDWSHLAQELPSKTRY